MWTSALSLTCLRVAKYHKAGFKTTAEYFSEMLLENYFSRQMLVYYREIYKKINGEEACQNNICRTFSSIKTTIASLSNQLTAQVVCTRNVKTYIKIYIKILPHVSV